MWPNIESFVSQNVLDSLSSEFYTTLSNFIEEKNLNSGYMAEFASVYLPLASWINNKQLNEPLIIGINGAQGSGKSTLSQLLSLILGQLFNKSVLHLSIDDLYLSREKRLQLSQSKHPLLKMRGVPGTHDVELGLGILKKVKYNLSESISLPVFDKSIDDLLPKEQWLLLANNIDIILFEGWCVGALPQDVDQLAHPINDLEKKHDSDAFWRDYVNKQLAGPYAALFSMIDYLVMLKVPDMESVFKWRKLQELNLIKNMQSTDRVMSENEIKQFILYFERITQQCLLDMPPRASVTLNINTNHRITRVDINDR